MADCQQENFYLRCVKIWKEMEKSLICKDTGSPSALFSSQPITNISFLWRVHFSAHANICPIRPVKLRRTVDFQRSKRQYLERPRPLSTVYFYQSTEYQ